MTGPRDGESAPAVCLDVGSCWTKAVLVRPDGTLAGFAEHPTTGDDVLTGVDAAVAGVAASSGPSGAAPDVLACSSAGGSLRLAAVGVERLAAIEAAHQVCRSAGARVVHVHAGPLEGGAVRELRSNRPGVVLLIGGSDGDDPAVLLHNASRIARARGRYPVVLAGNSSATDDALGLLRSTGRTVTACPNVVPRPGEIVAEPARAAIAELYSRHVLGVAPESVGPRFRRMVRTRTPVAVSDGVAALARVAGTGVVVVDVGSATTDVHSAVPDPDAGAGPLATVEGDLGVRASASGILVEAQAEGIVDPVEADLLGPSVQTLVTSGASVPMDRGSAAEERRLAAVAAVVALRRHLRRRPGSRERIGLIVLTGGVFRQRDRAGLAAVAETVRRDPGLMELVDDVEVRVDSGSVLAPAGLLATHGRAVAAATLLRDHLLG